MTHILRIDSSSRLSAAGENAADGSYSRWLNDYVVDSLSDRSAFTQTTTRDLVATPISHVSDDTIKGYYTPTDSMTDSDRSATALSDQLIKEVKDADVIVLSAPIYNFSVPSALKAWIDQVVRINQTFSYENGQFAGLVHGKKAYLILSYGAGGYANDGPLNSYDYLRPYLTLILNFIGISDVTVFSIEATTADAETIASAQNSARLTVDTHFANL